MAPHKVSSKHKKPQASASEETNTGKGRRMERNRVAAAALYCMFIMLSGQQQVAGLTRFCGCFGDCYPGCREDHPRWICTIKCVEGCAIVPNEEPIAAAAFGAGDCSKICAASICGAAETSDGPTDAGAAAACVDDCTANWKRRY